MRRIPHVTSVLAGALIVVLPAVVSAQVDRSAITDPASTSQLSAAVRLDPPERLATSAASDVVSLVNAERAARGLAPMAPDPALQRVAQAHSFDQARSLRMSHTGSDGSTAGTRLDGVGYRWRSWSENVAAGQPTPQAVMAAWMGSPGHRRNILSTDTAIGVGMAVGADGLPYWTQVFATPG